MRRFSSGEKRLLIDSGLRAAIAADTELSQNVFRGTKASEGRLKEVRADKNGEPQPVRTHIMSKCEAGENHGACEGADGVFELHRKWGDSRLTIEGFEG